MDKLQAKIVCFQTQVEKLTDENNLLVISNKNLSKEVNCLKEDLKTNTLK